ncbi:MAG: hypothetical protein ABR507_06350 [Actinomycetota bacterium]
MATEFDEPAFATDEEFQARLDDLLSSALEDQAKEQRFLLDMVQGARSSLSKAEEQMTTLRKMVEARDLAVVDLLEAKLSGLGSQESIDAVSERIEQLAESPGLADLIEPLGGRFEQIAAKVDAVVTALKPLDPWKPALEIQKNLSERLDSRLEPIDAALSELSQLIGAAQAPLIQAIEDSTRASGDLSISNMLEMSRTIDGFTSAIKRTVEALSASVLDARQETASELATLSSKLNDRLTQTEEAVAGDVDLVEDALSTLITTTAEGSSQAILGAIGVAASASTDSITEAVARGTEEQMSATGSAVRAALADLRELIRTHRELADASDQETAALIIGTIEDSNRAQLDSIDILKHQLDESFAQLRTGNQDAEAKVLTSINEMLQATSARLFDRMQTIRTEVEQMGTSVEALPSKIGSVVDEAAKAVLPFTEEMRVLSERVRQSNRRITESNTRVEAMNDSIVVYLAERDERLEKARDEILRDLVLQLSEDLKIKDKGRLAEAIHDAGARRKDRRDAERWRELNKGTDLSTERIDEVRDGLQAVLTRSILRPTKDAVIKAEAETFIVSEEQVTTQELAQQVVAQESSAPPATRGARQVDKPAAKRPKASGPKASSPPKAKQARAAKTQVSKEPKGPSAPSKTEKLATVSTLDRSGRQPSGGRTKTTASTKQAPKARSKRTV